MLATLCAAALLFVQGAPATQSKVPFFEGTGAHVRKVSTTSSVAQRYFDQGLNFMFAFNHDEARRSFRAAVDADPGLAMAWWGVAMSYGPHINNPAVAPEEAEAALAAIANAEAARNASPVERALISALKLRHAHPQPENRAVLDKAYSDAMSAVWKANSRDADIGALYAESLMNLHPWDFWTADFKSQPWTPEIVSLLERLLKLNGKHPLTNHLYIHAVEASPNPEKADRAANTLRMLQPGLGHNVHMPSHIDVRTGRWQDAILSNEKAIKADQIYRAQQPNQGFYRLYMSHNHHMLAFAAMMTGQREKALAAIDGMSGAVPMEAMKEMAPFLDGYVVMPLEVRVRFGMWDDILATPQYPEYFPLSRALQHVARGVAFAAKGNPAEARKEQTLFQSARNKVPQGAAFGNNTAVAILDVAQHLLEGEILASENKMEDAVAALTMAVRAEDRLRYDEPPDWIQPTRHTLGAALLRMGRFAEAQRVYEDDLKRLPNNGWGLYGMSQALAGLGQNRQALRYRDDYEAVWGQADIRITSSCMCLPGKG